ncbi:PEP-CTERM sorting domain-containing protein [Pseudorhodoferax sp.]|uniref:PEP-CTERM sorting domain-containing protein n=1 Tax=Pseudorhodoferax sp. TaxID=1993553 RepID=UPI0039E3F5F0
MTFSYSAKAQAGPQTLRAGVQATLTTPFYNASNPRYVIGLNNWDNVGGSPYDWVNPAGVPSGFSFTATASISDELQVVGGPGLRYVAAQLSIDGMVKGFPPEDPGDGYSDATLQDQQGQFYYTGVESSERKVHEEIWTNRHAVFSARVTFFLALSASVYFDLDLEELGPAAYDGYADFFDTVTIERFAGFDDAGQPVDLASVIGSDGHAYATVRVGQLPEPGVLGLFAAGLGGLAAAQRRREGAQA